MSKTFKTVFPTEPIIQAVGVKEWELKCDHENRFTHRLILHGFRFDGASIPRAFWRVAGHPMQGDVLVSAIEHDAEYSTQYISKEQADSNFRDNMKRSGVGFWKRNLFYYAVKFFGGIAWRKNQRKKFKMQCDRKLVLEI